MTTKSQRMSYVIAATGRCSFTKHHAPAPFVEGWLLHSPPAQQHNDHITKLKMFPVATLLDFF
jgi:hypothetical protein